MQRGSERYRARLRERLEELFGTYHHPQFLPTDPLGCVRNYRNDRDREIAGMVASALAYGRADIAIRTIDDVFRRCGDDLYLFVKEYDIDRKRRCLEGVRHRFNTASDIALLLEAAGCAIRDHGSIGGLFRRGLRNSGGEIFGALESFTGVLKAYASELAGPRQRSFEYLLSSPAGGSACKRMNMYLRWMVRGDDGVDLGVWEDVGAEKLIMPVDTHVARISVSMGLTGRRTADWRMAEEITSVLRSIDPGDPVRFDFSLCRAGILQTRGSHDEHPV